jgi:hypothetical protein
MTAGLACASMLRDYGSASVLRSLSFRLSAATEQPSRPGVLRDEVERQQVGPWERAHWQWRMRPNYGTLSVRRETPPNRFWRRAGAQFDTLPINADRDR